MLKRISIFIIAALALAMGQGGGLNHAHAGSNRQGRLKIRNIDSNTYGFNSLSGDLIEIGEERYSPPSATLLKIK